MPEMYCPQRPTSFLLTNMVVTNSIGQKSAFWLGGADVILFVAELYSLNETGLAS
jgi:hypothetical protein